MFIIINFEFENLLNLVQIYFFKIKSIFSTDKRYFF